MRAQMILTGVLLILEILIYLANIPKIMGRQIFSGAFGLSLDVPPCRRARLPQCEVLYCNHFEDAPQNST
jgi:hypothetical protein